MRNLGNFENLPLADFSSPATRLEMQQALASVKNSLDREYPLIVGAERIQSTETFDSINPSKPSQVLGRFQRATESIADKAVEAAAEAFLVWSRTSAPDRVALVQRVALLMRERRFELASWMVLEEGKSWVEADADVAEAIDFCEFYCREMLRLSAGQPLTSIPSEDNELRYIPLGVGVIIPPWNFPLAILTGMTMAAVVTGNTVVVKPSSDSPAIAAQLMGIIEEVGFPPGVVNFVTGSGSKIGEHLVTHPKTRFISFTGSKEVGLRINEKAAKHRDGQIWIKRVVAEMGGKDAIVVDEESNLDAAARAVVASAFGYQGQKCSACSRAIAVNSVYDELKNRLIRATQETIVEGDVEDSQVNFGPVINRRAQESILRYIETARNEGDVLLGGTAGSEEGFFVRPTIVGDVGPNAIIAREEIFGPVLALIRAQTFEEAIQIANDTDYGLTGAVFTRNPKKMERAKEEFHVGNLYFNRKCTGALVGAHPFGGFNMSGTDSKAGGRDYLLLFTQAKTIASRVTHS